MLSAFKRKFRQLVNDPVLRAWLIGRALGRYPAAPAFDAHQPPYLQSLLPLRASGPHRLPPAVPAAQEVSAAGAITVPLPGLELTLDADNPEAFFRTAVDDIEVDLARHRFAWLPLLETVPDGFFRTAWASWRRLFFDHEGMHWHPYSAAERAINLIDGMARFGAPDDARRLADDLAYHAQIIAGRLEYFGSHDTSNHLANNGRGLYRIGCALGNITIRTLGFDILAHEARRICLPSGMLREGSSHYHMLYLRNYLDVWLCARNHGHTADAETFRNIAAAMLAAARSLVLPGGLPLIGDISPDVPPAYLSGIEQGLGAWAATRTGAEQQMLKSLTREVGAASPDDLLADGWLNWADTRWSALAHIPPGGWPFMPGHAHQDMGSAEIHVDGQALFVDPGRGIYGDSPAAAAYRTSSVHGTLRIDDLDPYPANKPYYTNTFRARIAGPAKANIQSDGFTLTHGGYQRIGVDAVRRQWRFSDTGMRIMDAVTGHGVHQIERALVTPGQTRIEGNAVIIDERFKIQTGNLEPVIRPITLWQAYGSGVTGSRISFETVTTLPWTGTITVEDIR
ncbi:MAG: heparinase II/III family protein [Rhodospirillales bacterium]